MRILTGHDDRPVTVQRDRDRVVVHKQYPTVAVAAEVQRAMEALWRSPFGESRRPPGLPRPLGTEGAVVRMAFCTGEPIGRRDDPGRSDLLAVPCAQLLHDLHRSRVTVRRRRPAHRIVRSLHRKADALELAGSAHAEAYRRAVERLAARAPSGERLVVSHGDFSPRNLLAAASAPERPVLIDFDRIQMASPARDVAYWEAWRWATDLCRAGRASWDASSPFVAAYLEHAPAAVRADVRSDLGFHRAAALLRIAEGWSSLRARPQATTRIIEQAVHVAGGAARAR